MIERDESKERDSSRESPTETVTKTVRVEKLKIRTLKRLKGGFGASDTSSETVTNDCSCVCPPG